MAIEAGRLIGAGLTLLLLLLLSLAGMITVRRVGMRTLGRVDTALREGRTPGPELADTGMLFLAGLLLLFPGFVSGLFGLVLLVPPVRKLVRRPLERRLQRAAADRVAFFSTFRPGSGPGRADGVVITGEVIEDPPSR